MWAPPSGPLEDAAVAAAQQADAVVLFLGLTANLEGEEMRVQIPGFRGGDRTSIDLPAPQQRLLEKVVAVGKPTVLVLLNGSALAVNWAQENVPAIVEAWYPGQAGGSAIADVLFGDYNPGRPAPGHVLQERERPPAVRGLRDEGADVPLLHRHAALSVRPRPELHDLRVQESAHERRACRGGGHRSACRSTSRTAGRWRATRSCSSTCSHPASKVPRAIKELRGYRRVTLQPGETRTVRFAVPVSSLAYWNEQTHGWVVETAPVKLQVGASSADIRAERTIQVIGGGVKR